MSVEKQREGRVRAAIRKAAGEHAASRDDTRAGVLNLDVSGRLRGAIVGTGVTQSAVAKRANVPEETVSRIISGVTNDPRITTLVKLASALNVTVGWLLGEHTAPFTNAETEALARAIEILRVRIHAPQIDAEPNAVPALRVRVPRRYTVRGATLTFEARGDSLREVGILDGDRLFVRPATDVRQAIDEIAVCRVAGVLYVRRLQIEGDRILLVTEHDRMLIDEKRDFAVIGIVVARDGELAVSRVAPSDEASSPAEGDSVRPAAQLA